MIVAEGIRSFYFNRHRWCKVSHNYFTNAKTTRHGTFNMATGHTHLPFPRHVGSHLRVYECPQGSL